MFKSIMFVISIILYVFEYNVNQFKQILYYSVGNNY